MARPMVGDDLPIIHVVSLITYTIIGPHHLFIMKNWGDLQLALQLGF
jgi:hypothetical protein